MRLARLWIAAAALLAGLSTGLLGTCGPFTDVAADGFCPLVLEIFNLGITTGTTATTYDPASSVNRLQMAAFLSRSVDGVLKRGSRRAALGQFWKPQSISAAILGTTTGTPSPSLIQSDGKDLWVVGANGVDRYASDGKFLQNYATDPASGLLIAMGRVFSSYVGGIQPFLVAIDPRVTLASEAVRDIPDRLRSMTFDGTRIFGALESGPVLIVTVGDAEAPWTTTTVTTGFTLAWGTLFDGANVWVTDAGAGKLLKLNSSGAILQTVTVGSTPTYSSFDGANIWVPNNGTGPGANSVSVVRASTGAVLQTLTGNGIDRPVATAFDGERVLVTNGLAGTLSLFKAADFSPLGWVPVGGTPYGVCSDGINFWVALQTGNMILRF